MCGLHIHRCMNILLPGAVYFLLVGVGLFTPLPGAAFGGTGLGAEGAGLGAGWVLGWGISMGILGGMIVLGVRVGFASGIFSPWRYTLTWRERKWWYNVNIHFSHMGLHFCHHAALKHIVFKVRISFIYYINALKSDKSQKVRYHLCGQENISDC